MVIHRHNCRGWLAAGALAALLGASACQSIDDPALTGDPAFATGYSDGCRTGNARLAGFRQTVTRDEAAWDEKEAYRIGWRRGYNACGARSDLEDRQDFLQTDRYDQGAI